MSNSDSLQLQSLMIIQVLTHYTKFILKSLINQLCDISRCKYSVKFVNNFIVKQFHKKF